MFDPGGRGPDPQRLPVIVLALMLAGCVRTTRPANAIPAPADLGAMIEAHTKQVSATGPYRDPDRDERAAGRDAVRLLLGHPDDVAGQDAAFGRLGYTATHGIDPATDRRYGMFAIGPATERAWGLVVIDRSAPPRVVLEVPHPGFDINTDSLGLALYRLVPGSVLLIAGQHRLAGGGAADVAHNAMSMFHVLATEFARGGVGQVQLHGFADKHLPGSQVVVSTGAGPVTRLARDVADGLHARGLIVCRAWTSVCGRLEGTTNEQGRAAAEIGASFLHLELSREIRSDRRRRDTVAQVLAASLPGG